MVGEHYGENEEEDPKFMLDSFEKSLAMLALMVSQLLAMK
jgi:hypothetical protein